MILSYWEKTSWFQNVDVTIVGSGIVGLNTALNLKNRFPKANILILEKGILPQGASTKNAGFACFGSLSELLDDLQHQSDGEVFNLAKRRVHGLNLLRENLGDKALSFQQYGGYELFLKQDPLFDACISRMSEVNQLLFPLFNEDIFRLSDNKFHFKNIKESYIFNPFEGQIDTGTMMTHLLRKVQSLGVKILNQVELLSFEDTPSGVKLHTNLIDFSTSKLFVTNNAFASKLLKLEVKPARAQVLITKPIKSLAIKGTFHIDQGYYYFRNVEDRILFGGGRHLDFQTEETLEFGQTEIIQNALETMLKDIILPDQEFEIDQRWSGIMGVGSSKKPILEAMSNNVFCGVRLGGMGVAIGSLLGKELADLLE